MASKGRQPTMVKSMEVVKIDADGSVTVKFSAEALIALEQIMEAARPVIEAKRAQRVLKRGQVTLEKLQAIEREVKHARFAELQKAAKFGAMNMPPGGPLSK